MQTVIKNDAAIRLDIQNIEKIPILPQLLTVVCQTTGMGFAAVARVTDDKWVTCSVKDDILFGLKPGDELPLHTTICNEIRLSHQAVVIDHVATDPDFCGHHTPARYGFQSYISMPIMRMDGSFFGTLCAIDPQPKNLKDTAILDMFQLFAELISFHLHAIEQLTHTTTVLMDERAHHQQVEAQQKLFTTALEKKVEERTIELEKRNVDLQRMNKELEAFAYVSSHDLQEPLRKIKTFASRLRETELANLSEHGRDYFRRMERAADRMHRLINDLLAFSGISKFERIYEYIELQHIIAEVEDDMKEELLEKNAVIEIHQSCKVRMIPFQFRQLLHNLFNNSLKFGRDNVHTRIVVSSRLVTGAGTGLTNLEPEQQYCHLTISDNGIGFEQQYSEQIFQLFQRLHGDGRYPGTGLGLSIVERIVENHEGHITAAGQPGEGASFNIYLPTP